MVTQFNKHGIPVVTNSARPHKRRQQELRNLNFTEFAEFIGYEDGVEVTIIVPNHKTLVQSMLADGWKLQKYSRGEIA